MVTRSRAAAMVDWVSVSKGPHISPLVHELVAGLVAAYLSVYTVVLLTYGLVVFLEQKNFYVAARYGSILTAVAGRTTATEVGWSSTRLLDRPYGRAAESWAVRSCALVVSLERKDFYVAAR